MIKSFAVMICLMILSVVALIHIGPETTLVSIPLLAMSDAIMEVIDNA
jgi:hypothetical protein